MKLDFRSQNLGNYAFVGKFILIDRPDPETVFMTYDGIRFDGGCQAFKKPDKYPYFVVSGVENAAQ